MDKLLPRSYNKLFNGAKLLLIVHAFHQARTYALAQRLGLNAKLMTVEESIGDKAPYRQWIEVIKLNPKTIEFQWKEFKLDLVSPIVPGFIQRIIGRLSGPRKPLITWEDIE